MSIFLRHAEQILEVAVRGEEDVAIVIDFQGGVRMIDPAGWTLPSMRVEYGAGFVYKVERRAGMLRVEGWDGAQRCLLQRRVAPPPMALLPGLMPGLSPGLSPGLMPGLSTGLSPGLMPGPSPWSSAMPAFSRPATCPLMIAVPA